jgi:hypothetical protein
VIGSKLAEEEDIKAGRLKERSAKIKMERISQLPEEYAGSVKALS